MKVKSVLSIFLTGMMLISCAGCGKKEEPASAAEESSEGGDMAESAESAGAGDNVILIGASCSLTGGEPKDGLRMRQGIEMAVDEVNEAGGIEIDGTAYNLMLDVQDDAGTTEGAISAFNKLASEQCKVIIGPFKAGAAKAVADLAEQQGIPYFTGSASTTLDDLNTDKIFRVRSSDRLMVEIAAEVCAKRFEAQKVGMLYVSDDFGTSAMNEAQKCLDKLGRELVVETYNANDADMSGQLLKLKNSDVDCLLIWAYDADMVVISRQINDLGIDLPVCSSNSPAMAQVRELMNAEWIEGWYTVTDFCETVETEEGAHFRNAFRERYDADPEMFSAVFYGAVKCVAQAITDAQSADPEAIKDALHQLDGVEGPAGTYVAGEKGLLVHQGTLIQIKNNLPEFVDVYYEEGYQF